MNNPDWADLTAIDITDDLPHQITCRSDAKFPYIRLHQLNSRIAKQLRQVRLDALEVAADIAESYIERWKDQVTTGEYCAHRIADAIRKLKEPAE